MGAQRQPGAIAELWERGRLVWRLMNDQRVPRWLKIAVPAMVLLYFVWPLDVIPDFIPILGQMDDLGVLLLGMALFIRFSPGLVVDEHMRALGMDTNATSAGEPTRRTSRNGSPIEGEYTVTGNEPHK